MNAITVNNIGKAYKKYPHQWSRLLEWTLPFLGEQHQLGWILRDISFAVKPGESVGLIGINGAGKSTLLKIITGTTMATTGTVAFQGRVAALLELGMGFHPDFTGRQNVFMAAHLLGLGADKVEALMPQVEQFAEIGKYLDEPLRVYSSGMQMRLAFSVATVVRPDILIIDEALSVGDSYFQHKSFDRIKQFSRQGTTLLLVSHDKGAVQALCDRAILLNNGSICMEGAPDAVFDYYNALIAERGDYRIEQREDAQGATQTLSGSGEATISKIVLENELGQEIETVGVGEEVVLRIRLKATSPLPEIVLGYQIKDRLGQIIFGTNTSFLDCVVYDIDVDDEVEYAFVFRAALGEGAYTISVALHTGDTHLSHNYEWRDLALMFTVINLGESRFVGSNWLPPTVECTR